MTIFRIWWRSVAVFAFQLAVGGLVYNVLGSIPVAAGFAALPAYGICDDACYRDAREFRCLGYSWMLAAFCVAAISGAYEFRAVFESTTALVLVVLGCLAVVVFCAGNAVGVILEEVLNTNNDKRESRHLLFLTWIPIVGILVGGMTLLYRWVRPAFAK